MSSEIEHQHAKCLNIYATASLGPLHGSCYSVARPPPWVMVPPSCGRGPVVVACVLGVFWMVEVVVSSVPPPVRGNIMSYVTCPLPQAFLNFQGPKK